MLLECSGLKKSYGRKLAVRDITLNLEQGKIYGLLGPNGSGKTTWMKMVAGLVKGWEGSILFDGHALTYKDKAEITYMSTEPFFYSYMKIRDVGKYYSDFFADFSPERFEKLLMRMELEACSPRHTIVMSTHLVDEIEPMIDGAIFVRDGQIEAQGSVEELRQRYGLSIVDLYRRIYG